MNYNRNKKPYDQLFRIFLQIILKKVVNLHHQKTNSFESQKKISHWFLLDRSFASTLSVRCMGRVYFFWHFGTISGKGPLPRKSFSMGEADEKRFYLECRQIV